MYTEYGCFQHWYNTTFSMCFVDIHIINLIVCTLFMRGISRILYRTCMHLCLQQRLFWSSMMVKSHWPLIYMISIYNQQSSMSCCDMHPPTLAFVYEAQIKLWGWHGNTAPCSSQMLFICLLYMNMKHMVRKDYMTSDNTAPCSSNISFICSSYNKHETYGTENQDKASFLPLHTRHHVHFKYWQWYN